MNGHTGFLVTSRRMSPGERAPVPKRRPAPGAYGPEYDGPRREPVDGSGGPGEQPVPNRDETRATSPVVGEPDE
jgi:tRNA (adenine57-N1/adenine58-N1)-methyltransferase